MKTSVNNGFLGVTISTVTLSCSHYLYNIYKLSPLFQIFVVFLVDKWDNVQSASPDSDYNSEEDAGEQDVMYKEIGQ